MKRGGSQSGRSPGKSLLRLAWQSTLLLAVVAAFGTRVFSSVRGDRIFDDVCLGPVLVRVWVDVRTETQSR